MRHVNDTPPPLFQVADPNAARVDVERLTGQNRIIYDLLLTGPKTNMELAAVTPRYGARLYDLRKAGVVIETIESHDGTGLVRYRLKR